MTNWRTIAKGQDAEVVEQRCKRRQFYKVSLLTNSIFDSNGSVIEFVLINLHVLLCNFVFLQR